MKYEVTVPADEELTIMECLLRILGDKAFPFEMKTTPLVVTLNIVLDDEQALMLKCTVPHAQINKKD